MNFRSEAENRVERQRLNKLVRQERQSGISNRNRRSRHLINIDLPTDSTENLTPKIAALAETDYSLNGRRARCTSGEFVGPRWIPDRETLECLSCRTDFDWWTRRHHCRKCGKIFCGQCSSFQSLLPHDFGLRNPQRVCGSCFEELLPQQNILTTSIANHAQTNTIDILSYSLRRYFNFPISLTLGSEIRKAGYSTYNLCRQLYYIRDKTIPLGLLSNAKGLVFITVLKGGFMFAPHFGTGLIVALLPDGSWSAPSAIATCGVGYGALIGAAVVDYVLILSNYDAVAAFAGGGQVSVGGSVDFVVGPLGRSGSVDLTFGDGGCATVYSYSHSRGLYAGLSLEGSVLFPRPAVNHRFYGRTVSPKELLSGAVLPPRAAGPLYDALHEALGALSQPTYARIPLSLSMGSGNSSRSVSHVNASAFGSRSTSSAKEITPFGTELGRKSLDNRESYNSFESSNESNTSNVSTNTAQTLYAIDGKPRSSNRSV